jgi:hypothetical protein
VEKEDGLNWKNSIAGFRLATFLSGVISPVPHPPPVDSVKTLDVQLNDSLVQERLVGSLSRLFALLALLLTSVGLYGLDGLHHPSQSKRGRHSHGTWR